MAGFIQNANPIPTDIMSVNYSYAEHKAYWIFDCPKERFKELVKKNNGDLIQSLLDAEEEWLNSK